MKFSCLMRVLFTEEFQQDWPALIQGKPFLMDILNLGPL